MSLTGSLIAQNPNSLSDDPNITAQLRVNGVKYTYVAGNDLFNLSENNPSLKLCEMNGFSTIDTIDPQLVNVTQNAIEANTYLVGVGVGMGIRSCTVQNAVVHGNIMCGAYHIQTFSQVCAVGVTFSDNLCWCPDLASLNGVGLRGWITLRLFADATGGQEIPDAPVRLDRNTLVNDRSTANNENGETALFHDQEGQFLLAGVESAVDNLTHYPNFDVPQVPFAPLAADVLFVPRNDVGRIQAGDRPAPAPDTSKATPGPMHTFRPQAGSPALGAASAEAAGATDFTGYVRAHPTELGAWHNTNV